MASLKLISRTSLLARASQAGAASTSTRLLHASAARWAITNFQMPAMSPTMMEGGIASWKKKDGEAFAQGDVLLEIETDKATIDVEAQEDGIMGKILAPDGTKGVPVGKTIALLAEEGDDISNLEAPKEEAPPPPKEVPAPAAAPPPTPESGSLFTSDSQPPQSSEAQSHAAPEHSRPLFPSVHRLLVENNITTTDKIKGTGVRGMLTKGDVLTFLGKASGPLGTFKFGPSPIEEALASRATTSQQGAAPAPAKAPLDGAAIRRMVVSSMLQASLKQRNPPTNFKDADFDSVLADYLPPVSKPPPSSSAPAASSPKKSANYLDGLY
ncbi:pyruvate dehydrogenase X component [Pholiota conissans]|uniref:Pyruvate dehydrogenase X component n=1 Tax=Pholiota conissans TaxID=109636 RepID=A0A9P5ZCI8_9AGAR|nr:pyruvate dehydrogenase X component [Pholiota conissans]